MTSQFQILEIFEKNPTRAYSAIQIKKIMKLNGERHVGVKLGALERTRFLERIDEPSPDGKQIFYKLREKKNEKRN